MSLDLLPIEVLQFILRSLEWNDIGSMSLVCRRWAAAVEPILAARRRLAISHRAFSSGCGDTYAPANSTDYRNDKPKELSDILHNSNRNYTCLRVDWDTTITEQNMRALQEVLEVCRELFSPEKLHLKAFPCKALTDMFEKPCNWLDNLTDLHFEQCKSLHRQSVPSSTMEISLPKLKRLTWLEEEPRRSVSEQLNFNYFRMRTDVLRATAASKDLQPNPTGIFQSAALDVPELERLTIKVAKNNETSRTRLQLQFCSNLQYACIEDLLELDQRLIIQSQVWQNLKSLKFNKCASQVIERILENCSNLQELIVYHTQGHIPFENLSVLSRSLKQLTLQYVPIGINNGEEIPFPELQYIRITMNVDDPFRISQRLNAPNLTKIFISRLEYDLLRISDKQETGTMVLELNPLHKEAAIPLPNVTEISLDVKVSYSISWSVLFQDYLNCCPNLRRLTVNSVCNAKFDLKLQNCSKLEYLCGKRLILWLEDFHRLINLKSLKLTACTITANPDDGEAILTTLRFIQLDNVKLKGTDDRTWDHFPISGSYQQPSIVKTSTNVFNSSD